MEGIRELGLRRDQVRWYMEDGGLYLTEPK
jgi:hypothetical protein